MFTTRAVQSCLTKKVIQLFRTGNIFSTPILLALISAKSQVQECTTDVVDEHVRISQPIVMKSQILVVV